MASRIVARVTPSGNLLIGGSAFLGEEAVRFTPKGDLRVGQILEGGAGFRLGERLCGCGPSRNTPLFKRDKDKGCSMTGTAFFY